MIHFLGPGGRVDVKGLSIAGKGLKSALGGASLSSLLGDEGEEGQEGQEEDRDGIDKEGGVCSVRRNHQCFYAYDVDNSDDSDSNKSAFNKTINHNYSQLFTQIPPQALGHTPSSTHLQTGPRLTT